MFKLSMTRGFFAVSSACELLDLLLPISRWITESLQLSGYQIALDHYLGGHGIKSCHRLNNLFFVGHAFSMLNYLKLQLYFLIKLTRLPRPDPNFTLATVSLESSV